MGTVQTALKTAFNWFMTPSGVSKVPTHQPTENYSPRAGYANRELLYTQTFNGEKNFGEMGPMKNYMLDYTGLRIRSWQSFLESEISQTVLKKFTLWIVGSGLKLQCEPSKQLLESERIKIDPEAFNNEVESRWGVWAKTKVSHSGMKNLHKIAKEAHKNAIIGGDVLVILRVIKGKLTVQLIDGAHVQSPIAGSEWYPQQLPNGNQLINGIEMDESGQHVAYYIQKKLPHFGFERIEARNSVGMLMCYMVYGLEYRLDNNRGMPLIAGVLETIKKMERYKEATIGSAEERQKIVYTVEHGVQSTGESPLLKRMAMAHDADSGGDDLPEDINGRKLASEVAASTNKQVFNMPIDSKLVALESKGELYFKDFYTIHIDVVCATIGIPPNVAMSSYNDSFSASRAATKDWEHTIKVNREDFADQFYQPIYDAFLTLEVLKQKITAPGFLKSLLMKDSFVIGAYTCARFTGPMFPHIDPLKEANAERVKLGALGVNIPLTTAEKATEVLDGGDSESNMRQFAEELADMKENGIEISPAPANPKKKKVEPDEEIDD